MLKPLLIVLALAAILPAQAAEDPAALDPAIQQVLADISAQRIEQHIRTLVSFGTRHTLSETASDTRGIGAARRWIQHELQDCSQASGGRLQVTMDEFVQPAGVRLTQPVSMVDVVATLPGGSPTSKARLLVVSGHYDSRVTDVMNATADAPGANDDASGTAAVMEMACAFARQAAKQPFDATLVFMSVPGEEQGLYGATYWATEARRKGLKVEAMITNDIIGSSHGEHGQYQPKEVRLFVNGLDPILRRLKPGALAADPQVWSPLLATAQAGGQSDLPTDELGRHLKEAGERYVPGFSVRLIDSRDRYLRGGDHIPFLEAGYAAVRFTEPVENFDHQHQDVRTENGVKIGDLPEFVDFNYVADVARINAAGLATLALAPPLPENVRLDASGLTNDSTLSWDAGSAAELAGYRVVWRDSGASVWQHSQDVGPATRVTLSVSKDNVIFGVESVSKRGEASYAVYPLPLRH